MASTRKIPLSEAVGEIKAALQNTKNSTTGGDKPVRAITPSAIGDNQRVDWSRLTTIYPKRNEAPYRVHPGDLLLVLHQPLRMAVFEEPSPEERKLFAADERELPIIACGMMAILRPDKDGADSYYLNWQLSQAATMRDLTRLNSGTTLQFITMQSLKQLPIAIPDHGTQQRIRRVLEAQRRIELLQGRHRELMRYYLDSLAQNLIEGRTENPSGQNQ